MQNHDDIMQPYLLTCIGIQSRSLPMFEIRFGKSRSLKFSILISMVGGTMPTKQIKM